MVGLLHQDRLQGVYPGLQSVLEEAARRANMRIGISEGLRDSERQKQLVAEGKSQTMNSRHLHGRATDIHLFDPEGNVTWDFPQYQNFWENYVQPVSQEMGIPLVWGGNWKSLRDGVHFELAPDYKPEFSGGPTQMAAAPVRASGGATTAVGGASMDALPRGLLASQEQQPEKRGLLGGLLGMDRDRSDTLAMALMGMSMMPNEGLQQVLGRRMEGRREDRRLAGAKAEEAAAREDQKNRTLEALRRIGAPPEAIALAEAGFGAEALRMATTRAEAPTPRTDAAKLTADFRAGLITEEQYQRGLERLDQPEAATPRTLIAKATADYRAGLLTEEQYQGQLAAIERGDYGAVTGSSGTTVNNNITGDAPPPVDSALRNELMKDQGALFSKYVEAGTQAANVRGDLEALRALSEIAPSGPLAGRLAEMFPEANDASAARQAIIKRVAPQLRVEGSGSTSDVEYAGMIEGLGRLTNSPEANVAIADMMLAKSELDMQRASIVNQYSTGQMPYEEAVRRLEEINQTSIMPDSLRSILAQGQPTEDRGRVIDIDGNKYRVEPID